MQTGSFRLSLKFILPVALVWALLAYAVVPWVDNLTVRWFVRDLDTRSQMLAAALQDPLQEYVRAEVAAQDHRTVRPHCEGRAPVCAGALRCRRADAVQDPHLSAIAGLHGDRDFADFAAKHGAAAAGLGARHRKPVDGRGQLRRQADPGARHQLHRAAQRRCAQVCAGTVRLPGGGDGLADHPDRPPEPARRGQCAQGRAGEGCPSARAARRP